MTKAALTETASVQPEKPGGEAVKRQDGDGIRTRAVKPPADLQASHHGKTAKAGKPWTGFQPPADRKQGYLPAGNHTGILQRWAVKSASREEKEREAGWAARIILHETGKADEPVHVFREAYIAAVLEEKSPLVLEVLKDMNPTALDFREVVRKAWGRRLNDPDQSVASVAKEALSRLSVPQVTAAGRKYIRRANVFAAFELCRDVRRVWETGLDDTDPLVARAARRARALLSLPPAAATGRERIQSQRDHGSSLQDRDVTGPGR